MKRLNTVTRKMTKKASDTSIIEAYKQLFVDYIHSKHFPILNKDYLEDLCWDEYGQEIAENLEVGEEEYTDSEHSIYYEKIYGYYEVDEVEKYLEGKVHIDYSLTYTKNEDGSCSIILDVYPEMKTEDYGTFGVQDGFTIYGTSDDFETMASEAQQEKQNINTSYIEVF